MPGLSAAIVNLLAAFTAMVKEYHPMLILEIQGNKYEDMFDTDTEVSVIFL